MVLSKREQLIVLLTVITVGLLIGNKFVYEPLREKRAALVEERDQLAKDREEANLLLLKMQRDKPLHKQLTEDGFKNEDDADNKVAVAINEWSQKCGMTITSTRPEPVSTDKNLQEIRWQLSGNGSLDAAAKFIFEIEASKMPIKITSLTLGSNSDAGEKMTLALGVSAVYPGTAKSKKAIRPEAKVHEEEAL
jgi:hypothetical protein